MGMKVVIVGADAAGMSAASKLKREKPDSRVIVFERDSHISYAACGMPYWFSGLVTSDEDLKALRIEEARNRRDIDVRIRHEVLAIDRGKKTIEVQELDTGRQSAESYDKLVIATGASPIRPPIPGLDLPGVFTLRSLTEGQRINDFLKSRHPRCGVIIGGGYIGLELAESFRYLNMETHVVEMLPQIMPNMDPDMMAEVRTHLEEQEVHVHTRTRVKAIESAEDRLRVQMDSAPQSIFADIVIVATGIQPNSEIAATAGLELSARNAIKVNDYMQTSDPDIYAAGDCVAYRHRVLEKDVWIPLAPAANKGGRIVGQNLAGQITRFPGILGTAVVKVFDYTLATTGLTQVEAERHADQFSGHIDAVITAQDKSDYYPGAKPVKIKIIVEKATGRILGAQLVSRSDVSKRADIFAIAIAAGMTVSEFSLLDLTYAPPYAPVYDPVLIAASVAEGLLNGEKSK